MTLLRQAFYAGLLLCSVSATRVLRAEPLAPIGPPTAADLAAAALTPAPTPVAAPAPAPAVAKPPTWLAKRPAPKAAATGTSAIPSTGRMLGLVLVMGSLGGAALYLKRRGRPDAKRAALPQRLSVLSSTRIGPKAHAVVISVAGRQMLLGVTDSSVKRLAFIDEIEEDEREREREPLLAREPAARRAAAQAATRGAGIAVHTVSPTPAKAGSFADMLKTAFGKRAPEPETDAASILAAETHDSVGGKAVAGNPGNVRMLDVEGQAQGLIRRLSGPRA
jgi:flagellar biogenesis protein FliO